MIAADTHLLVYPHRRELRLGDPAQRIIAELAEGDQPWAIPWPCCFEFLRMVTNRRLWKDRATTPKRAWHQFQAWAESPSSRLIGETGDFPAILGRFVDRPRVFGGVVHDARVAAICVAHGVEALLTRDRDFSLFPELQTRNPFKVADWRQVL